jgi:hypothetical protein
MSSPNTHSPSSVRIIAVDTDLQSLVAGAKICYLLFCFSAVQLVVRFGMGPHHLKVRRQSYS